MRIVFLIISCLPLLVFSQNDRIDSVVAEINTNVIRRGSIKGFSIIKFNDSDTTRQLTTYYIDTTNCFLQKVVYDCTFNGKELIEFYFHQSALLKITVDTESYKNILYMEKDSLVSARLLEPGMGLIHLDSESLRKRAKAFIVDNEGICKDIIRGKLK